MRKGGLMNSQTNTNFKETMRGKEINVKAQIAIIKSRVWVLIIITILTTSLGIIKNEFFTTPIFETSTRLIISADSEYMKTLIVLVKDPAVLEKVRNELGVDRLPEQLMQQINVGSIEGSQVIKISVIDRDPTMAAEIANTTARIYKSELPKIVGFNEVKLLTEAKVNSYPINSDETRTIIMAIVVGVILGVGLIYLLYALDDSITSNDEIEELVGLTVLGTVSKMNTKNTKKKNKRINEMEIRGETVGL
jgi:capsular polysaccharide biosynthesis protein